MPRIQTTLHTIEENKPKSINPSRKRRVISIITPIEQIKEIKETKQTKETKEIKEVKETKQIEEPKEQKQPITKNNQIEADDFELFEDTSANTKIVPRQKLNHNVKLTKTQIQVQKKANQMIENNYIPKIEEKQPNKFSSLKNNNSSKNYEEKKMKDIWKVKKVENEEELLKNLKAPKIDPINPLWHPKMNVVKGLNYKNEYKKYRIMGDQKIKKLHMGYNKKNLTMKK